MKNRPAQVLSRVSLAGIGIAFAFWIIPAPLAGYWHTPLSDCLCDSKNLIAFEGGKVYQWASNHGQVREEFGTYKRGIFQAEWDTGKERVIIHPGWFFMRITILKDPEHPEESTYSGYRELRPSYIKEVLATKKKPAKNKTKSL